MKDNTKLIIKISTYVVLIIVSLLLSFLFLSKSIKRNITENGITTNANIDYKVYLKDNAFYSENNLPSEMEYISSLINYIDTNLVYNMTATKDVDYKYTYYIEAVTRVYGDTNKSNIIFEQSDILLEEKTVELSDINNYLIQENIQIDYNKYNMLAAAFKTSYYLTSTSDVTVTLVVNTFANDTNIIEKSELIIPLTEQTTEVKITYPSNNQYTLINNEEPYLITNKFFLIISGLLVITALVCLFFILKEVYILLVKKQTKYDKELKRILREYDLIIANANFGVNESNYTVVNLPTFEELRDVHDNIGKPILFKEKKGKATFVLIEDNFLYKYILRKND